MQPGSCLGPLSLLMKGEMLPAGSSWSGIPSEPKDAPASRERTLMKVRFRQSGDAVRRWAAQYTRALAAFATATEPLPTEPGFQERIQSPDFREDWQQRLREPARRIAQKGPRIAPRASQLLQRVGSPPPRQFSKVMRATTRPSHWLVQLVMPVRPPVGTSKASK